MGPCMCVCMCACTGRFRVSHHGCGHPGVPEVRVRPTEWSQRSPGNCLTGETFLTWVRTHTHTDAVYICLWLNMLKRHVSVPVVAVEGQQRVSGLPVSYINQMFAGRPFGLLYLSVRSSNLCCPVEFSDFPVFLSLVRDCRFLQSAPGEVPERGLDLVSFSSLL